MQITFLFLKQKRLKIKRLFQFLVASEAQIQTILCLKCKYFLFCLCWNDEICFCDHRDDPRTTNVVSPVKIKAPKQTVLCWAAVSAEA